MKKTTRQMTRAQLHVEVLEERCVLNATLTATEPHILWDKPELSNVQVPLGFRGMGMINNLFRVSLSVPELGMEAYDSRLDWEAIAKLTVKNLAHDTILTGSVENLQQLVLKGTKNEWRSIVYDFPETATVMANLTTGNDYTITLVVNETEATLTIVSTPVLVTTNQAIDVPAAPPTNTESPVLTPAQEWSVGRDLDLPIFASFVAAKELVTFVEQPHYDMLVHESYASDELARLLVPQLKQLPDDRADALLHRYQAAADQLFSTIGTLDNSAPFESL